MDKSKDKSQVIPIYAAISPRGEIVKSSIGTFRVHAQRFAMQNKNFTVVKLADINPTITGLAPKPKEKEKEKPEVPAFRIEPQKLDTKVEVPKINTSPKRKYTRRQAAEG